ncbi:MAG TPA: DUF427 domain-containing protein [Caulobacteraceae bacterium]|jgi:uncharacterized protein (DUF427 family)
MDVVKVPGPEHPITITGHGGRLQALYNGHLIADSGDVLILKEASYKPVAYFPREDVEMGFLASTGLDTYCPYKGHASYFTITMDGKIAESAVWTYESPHPAMEIIKDRLAFYPNFVEIHEVGGAHAGPDAAVLHTDSGGGSSQGEHWAATANNPRV